MDGQRRDRTRTSGFSAPRTMHASAARWRKGAAAARDGGRSIQSSLLCSSALPAYRRGPMTRESWFPCSRGSARSSLALVLFLALLAAALPGSTAPSEPLRFALAPGQTVYLPGDTLHLLVTLANPGAAIHADLYAGVVLPDGRVRMVTATLELGAPEPLDARTVLPVAADLVIPAGFTFPAADAFTLDTNADGIPDAFGLSTSIMGFAPGSYLAFGAALEPGSAATGEPRLLAPPVMAPFEVRLTGTSFAFFFFFFFLGGARLYVVNPDSGSVSAVDTEAEIRVAETPVGARPLSLAIGPEGRRLFVASHD